MRGVREPQLPVSKLNKWSSEIKQLSLIKQITHRIYARM